MDVYIITRQEQCKKEASHEAPSHKDAGFICHAARYWEDPDFRKYLDIHGEHFSRKLSMWACGRMENRNGVAHSWTPEQVEAAVIKMGHTLAPDHKYDAHYLANMAYADYLGNPIEGETGCVQYAVASLTDPDGYPEKAFVHWLSDAMKECLEINWADVI